MRRLINRIERKIVSIYEFWQCLAYYLNNGYGLRAAYFLARNRI